MLTRRGFLGTMFAAAAGAVANFDPLKGLWVPGRALEAASAPTIIIPETTWTKAVIDEQLELNDLAARFARLMSPRLHRADATILRRMVLAQTGQVNVGLITLTDDAGREAGRGRFTPAPYRIAKDMNATNGNLALTADVMRGAVSGFDVYAPIGTQLREGVPFTDCLVGVGSDPETGLSARALRFKTTDGILHTECELAVGDWQGSGAHSRRRKGQTIRMLLTPEQVAAQETIWRAEAERLESLERIAGDIGDMHVSASQAEREA